MELYGKVLIYVVFLLVGLQIIQSLLYKKEPETFSNIRSTIIQTITPNEGDSSTVVKLAGTGFDNVSKIFFKIGSLHAQAIILDNRNDKNIEILPPPISELGKNILDIRNSIIDTKMGIKTKIVFILGEKKNNEFIDLAIKPEDRNVVTVEGLYFYYIDRIPYQNNCPQPPEPPAETEIKPELTEGNTEIEYPKDTDLEFLNKILPEKQEKLSQLEKEVHKNLDKYINNINTNSIDKLKQLQAIESVEEMKKQFNRERFHIHNYLNKEYNMGLNL